MLQAAGVILAIKRWRNKVINLYQYYEDLEDYLLENFPEEFPDNLPDYILDDLPEGFLESFSNLPTDLSNLTSAEIADLDLPSNAQFPESAFSGLAEYFPYIFPNGAPQAVGFLRPGIFPKVKFGDREGGDPDNRSPLLRRADHSPPSHNIHPLSAQPLPSTHLLPPVPQDGVPSPSLQVYQPKYSSSYQKRSLQEPSPSSPPDAHLRAAVQGVLETEDIHEVVVRTAQLVQEVVQHMDEDDCLLKFMCHIQQQPQDSRAPEQDLLVRLFQLNATAEASECWREFTNCPVQLNKLSEAFSYSWQTRNSVEGKKPR